MRRINSFRLRCLTLLEIMIVIIVIAITSSMVGIRLNKALKKREYEAAADRLYSEFATCRQVALNTQTDQNAALALRGGWFFFSTSSPETSRSITLSWKASCSMRWNKQETDQIAFLFSATGVMMPSGQLELFGPDGQRIHWVFPDIFSIAEGSDGAVPRPKIAMACIF
jgi:type II secretory pathway pseudopilin PulG